MSLSDLIYVRTISVQRAKVTNAVGLVPYSGVTIDGSGLSTILSGIPASIQAGQTGRKRDSALPQDAVFAPTWFIFIPFAAVAKGLIRDRDYVTDDENYRYQVAQAYWNILGWKLISIRQEA